MRVTFLGTGTSQGVPVIGCKCPVCVSPLKVNKRTRSSVWLEFANRQIIIDTTPEFRLQVLKHGPHRLDALLFTHAHADHICGFDDIRRFCQMQQMAIPVYASSATLHVLQGLFGYAFDLNAGNWAIPRAEAHEINGPFNLFGRRIEPLVVFHGNMPINGFRIGGFAYLTDCSYIPEKTEAVLQDLDVLVLDALRYRAHPTHFTIAAAVQIVARLKPKHAFLTHICHEVDHDDLIGCLPTGIAPAFDGLSFETPDPSIW
jgi:phosphoribosyl 1,2-cyclic phosphate phosphodiesterase